MRTLQAIVIGAGQAGLSVGYHLAQRGVSFVILEARDRIGDVWRDRWDSLRLFTPARFDGLAGMPFPGRRDHFPTKDAMADYLERYAARFELPVFRRVEVDRVFRQGERYLVAAKGTLFEAEHVVVAMANFQRPKVPAFARDLAPDIAQMHSHHYRNPESVPEGSVLVVGAGNSGAEIALELAKAGRRVWLSGRDVGHIPFRADSMLGRLGITRLVLRFIFHRLLTLDTPMGRTRYSTARSLGGPLIRVRPGDLAAAGVERVPRVTSVRYGEPVLEDGCRVDPANIIWCTGFQPGFSWVDAPVFRDDGEPIHYRGVVTSEPGLYFVGLHWLYAMSSAMIHGVDRDAEHVAETVARRVGARRSAAGSPALATAWW